MDANKIELNEIVSTQQLSYSDGKISKHISINSEIERYINNHCHTPNKFLPVIREMAKSETWGFMQTSSDQSSFLYLITKISNAKNVLEIGCFLGHSTISFASALPENGNIITIWINVFRCSFTFTFASQNLVIFCIWIIIIARSINCNG